MSTEAHDQRTRHALRLAFGAPAAYLLADWADVDLPFMAGAAYVLLASKMAFRPPLMRLGLLFAVAFAVLPLLAMIVVPLAEHPILRFGLVGLGYFVGFRLQADARTRSVGAFLVLLAIVMPMADLLFRPFNGLLDIRLFQTVGSNLLAALTIIVLSFVAFPAMQEPSSPAPVVTGQANATREAATSALLMMPLAIGLAVFNNPEATRVLLVASTVLVATTGEDERQRIGEVLVGLAFAGCVGLATTTFYSFWPVVAAALSVVVAAGLLVGRRVVDPVRGGAFASGLMFVWPLLAIGGMEALSQTMYWLALAVSSAGYVAVLRRPVALLLEAVVSRRVARGRTEVQALRE